jgi:hypothetical protein
MVLAIFDSSITKKIWIAQSNKLQVEECRLNDSALIQPIQIERGLNLLFLLTFR